MESLQCQGVILDGPADRADEYLRPVTDPPRAHPYIPNSAPAVRAEMLARLGRGGTRRRQLHAHHLGRHQRHGRIDDDGRAYVRGDLFERGFLGFVGHGDHHHVLAVGTDGADGGVFQHAATGILTCAIQKQTPNMTRTTLPAM